MTGPADGAAGRGGDPEAPEGLLGRIRAAADQPEGLRRGLFAMVLGLNAANMIFLLVYGVRFVDPAEVGWVRPFAVAFLLLQLPGLWSLRRGSTQPVYFAYMVGCGAVTILLHMVAIVPVGAVLGSLLVFLVLELVVSLVLLDVRWFLPLAAITTLGAVAVAASVLVAQPEEAIGFMAAIALIPIVFQWVLTSALALLLDRSRRNIRASQAALAASNEHLAAEVARQTAQIAEQQRQLFEATKLEALGTLAGGVAHDFNNLLQGIQSNVEFLRGEVQVREHLQELELIQHCVDSGADLVRDLMGYGHAGKYEVGSVDVRRLIDRTTRLFGRAHKGVRLDVHVEPDAGTVRGDHTQLQQVLLNILNNAAQAVEEHGTVTIEAAAIRLDDDAPAVRLSVRDDGPGMDEATRRRVFEPFFTTKPKGRGTGLGLASAWGIVSNHGGRLEADSAPGEGATFNILLPAGDALADEPPGPAAAPAPAPEASAAPAPASAPVVAILVVDDEQIVRSMTSRMLKALGYRAYAAGTRADAVATLEAHRAEIKLVLLDMIMPGATGGEVFDQLRALEPELRVVLSTGFAGGADAKALLERGCVGVLAKPYGMEELGAQVATALEG